MKKYSSDENSNNDLIVELPVDWKVKKLKYFSKINRLSLTEDTDPNYEIQYIDIGNVNINGLVAPPLKILLRDAPSRARRIVGSILNCV